MCQRQAIFIKKSEIRKILGECDIVQNRGSSVIIKIHPNVLDEAKRKYLDEIAILDDTTHSKSEVRFLIKWGIIIEDD